MSISRAAEELGFSVDPIIHIKAVLFPPDPLISLKRIKCVKKTRPEGRAE